MASFEFAKHSCKYKGVQGSECQSAPLAFWKNLKRKNTYNHGYPWEKLPQNHIWYAIFEFWKAPCNLKRNEGLLCKITTTPNLEGAKCKMDITTVISGPSYLKFIYWITCLLQRAFEIQIQKEFEFKRIWKKKNKKKRRGALAKWAALGRQAHFLLSLSAQRTGHWTRATWARPRSA